MAIRIVRPYINDTPTHTLTAEKYNRLVLIPICAAQCIMA